jgi:hypothetical protein
MIIGLLGDCVMKAILADYLSREEYLLELRGQRFAVLRPVGGLEDALTTAFIL